MNKWTKIFACAALCSGILAGCSSNDDAVKIAPLPLITTSVEVVKDWEHSVGNGSEGFFTKLMPAIAYGKVFASDRDGIVAAFDQETGNKLWQVALGEEGNFFSAQSAQLSGGIATGYDKIVVGAESGMLFVLNQADGSVVWQKQVDGELLSKPLLAMNKVVSVLGNGKVIAFDLATGEQSWIYQQDVPALTLRGTSGIIENQGAAFFGMPSGKIAGVLLEDGRAIWEAIVTPAAGGNELTSIIDVDSTPIILGGTMYAVGYNGNLAAIEVRSGKVLWKRDYSAFQSLTINGFNLYLTTADGHVFAIDRRSGLEVWSQMGLENRGLTAPAIFGDSVAVVDFEGYLHLLAQDTGEFVAQIEIDDDGHIAAPLSVDGRLYLQSKDGLLTALSIK